MICTKAYGNLLSTVTKVTKDQGDPVVQRDTRHELKQGLVGRRSSNARQLGCVFQDMEPPKLSKKLKTKTKNENEKLKLKAKKRKTKKLKKQHKKQFKSKFLLVKWSEKGTNGRKVQHTPLSPSFLLLSPPPPPSPPSPLPPNSPCVGEERRAGLGQALPTGFPIVGSRLSQYRRYCGQHYYILRCPTPRTPCHRLRLCDPHCHRVLLLRRVLLR